MANKDSVNCYSASLPVSSVSGSSHNPRFVHSPCKRKLVLDNSCGSGSSLAQRMRDSSPTPPRKAQRAVSQSATSPQALVPRVILLARNRDTSSPQQSSVAQSSVSKDTESLPVQSDTSALPVRVSEREHASQPVAAHPALPTSPTRGPFRGQPPMAAVAHARPSRGGRGGLLEIPRNFMHDSGAPPARGSSSLAGDVPRPQVDREHPGQRVQATIPLDPPPRNGGSRMPSEELNCALAREVEELLRKEAIKVVPPQDMLGGHYSRYFLVPKKPEGFRPILDLRGLNPTITKKEFCMLTNNVLLANITHGDWLTCIDLKDAYFHVGVHPNIANTSGSSSRAQRTSSGFYRSGTLWPPELSPWYYKQLWSHFYAQRLWCAHTSTISSSSLGLALRPCWTPGPSSCTCLSWASLSTWRNLRSCPNKQRSIWAFGWTQSP